MKGTKATVHADGVLSPEELEKAIKEYKERRAQAEKQDGDAPVAPQDPETKPVVPAEDANDADPAAPAAPVAPAVPSVEDKVQTIKDKQDAQEDPDDLDKAKALITDQDEDISTLFDIIDTLLAERDFKGNEDCSSKLDCSAKLDDATEPADPAVDPDADEDPNATQNTDSDEDAIPDSELKDVKNQIHGDSVDYIVRTRIRIDRAGRKLNMDGLENLSIKEAKKRVVNAVRPTMRLDGKSDAYIDAAFDQAYDELSARNQKDTNYQIKQMFNKDTKRMDSVDEDSADAARARMIAKRQKNN